LYNETGIQIYNNIDMIDIKKNIYSAKDKIIINQTIFPNQTIIRSGLIFKEL